MKNNENRFFLKRYEQYDRIIAHQKDNNYKYTFVNLLKFANQKYKISTVDLAKIFRVHRQTMYDYYKKEDDDFPDEIKKRLKEIYDVDSLEDIYKNELEIELRTQYETDLINCTTNYQEDLNINVAKELKVLDYAMNNFGEYNIIFNNEYDTKEKYMVFLREINNFNENNIIFDKFKNFINRNTQKYNENLLSLLMEFNPNDPNLMLLLNEQFKYERVRIINDLKEITFNDFDSNVVKTFFNISKNRFKFKISLNAKNIDYLHEKLEELDIKEKDDVLIDTVLYKDISTRDLDFIINNVKKSLSKSVSNIITSHKVNYELNDHLINIYIYKY